MFIKDIIKIIEDIAPIHLKEDFDNIGLLIGNEEERINKILLALDITDEVIEEAIYENCNLIITHHPIIFKSIKNINSNSDLGKKIIKLIKNDISVYTAHTNLDSCSVGTNDVLFDLLNLQNKSVLIPNKNDNTCGLGRVGELKDLLSLESFINVVKQKLNIETISYCDDNDGLKKNIKKVGLCTGSAGKFEYINVAKNMGCDVYITGDLDFHGAQLAKQLGISLIDAKHYNTEVIVLPKIKEYLLERDERLNVIVSKVDGQTIKML